jgi:hypothetical protein
VPVRAPKRARAVLLFAPLWAGLAAGLSASIPFAGLFLLPFGASRLARAARALPGAFRPLLVAALSVPAAFLLTRFLIPGAEWLAALTDVAFVALPAAAIVAGARDGRRRDRVLLLAAACTGIGALAALLGVALATGRDPGAVLAERLGAATPEILAFYKSAGWTDASIGAVAHGFELARAAIGAYLPGIVLAGCVLHAALVVYAFGGGAPLAAGEMSETPFSRFATPLAAAVLFVPAGLVAAVGPRPLLPAAVDALLPLVALFFLRGLAIIRALLDRGRAGLLGRAIVYTLVLQMPIPVLLALGGLFDEFLDVRGRLERRDRTLRSK